MKLKKPFKRLKNFHLGNGYTSDYFDPIEKPRLVKNLTITKDDVDNLLTEDLTRSVRELKNKFPDFDEYPLTARQALLDMQFNLGDRKFQTEIYDTKSKKWKPGWPKLIKAVEEKGWETAAKESHRKGVAVRRNKRIAN